MGYKKMSPLAQLLVLLELLARKRWEWIFSKKNADRCVCCGEIIPEGRMVCPNCLLTVKEIEND